MVSSSSSTPWSETRQGRLVVLVGMGVLFGLVFWLALQSRRLLARPPALVVEEQYLWLGEVWEDPAFVWTLPIRNTTDEDIAIAGFNTSCSCSKLEPSSLTVPAHGVAEVRLTLNLLNLTDKENHDELSYSFAVSFSPILKKHHDVQSHHGWTIRGKVRRLLEISPNATISFDDQLTFGQPFPKAQAKVKAAVALDDIFVECDPNKGRASIQKIGEQQFLLTVSLEESHPVGSVHFPIILRPCKGTENLPRKAVAVEAYIHNEIEPLPELIALGACQIGSTLQETVRLISRTGKNFYTDTWRVHSTAGTQQGNDVKIEKIVDSPNDFSIRIFVNSLGDQRREVYFVTKIIPEKRSVIVRLPLSFWGIASH